MWRNYRTRRNRRNWRSRNGDLSLLLAQGVKNVARLRNMGQINLGLERFVAVGPACPGSLVSGMFVAGAEVHPHLFRLEILQRAGMRFFLSDPQPRQRVGDRLALDFQFSRQIVDSNLTHPPLSSSPNFQLRAHINLTV
jgi:hypothetical protein